jgi:hypothetical protein
VAIVGVASFLFFSFYTSDLCAAGEITARLAPGRQSLHARASVEQQQQEEKKKKNKKDQYTS